MTFLGQLLIRTCDEKCSFPAQKCTPRRSSFNNGNDVWKKQGRKPADQWFTRFLTVSMGGNRP